MQRAFLPAFINLANLRRCWDSNTATAYCSFSECHAVVGTHSCTTNKRTALRQAPGPCGKCISVSNCWDFAGYRAKHSDFFLKILAPEVGHIIPPVHQHPLKKNPKKIEKDSSARKTLEMVSLSSTHRKETPLNTL